MMKFKNIHFFKKCSRENCIEAVEGYYQKTPIFGFKISA